MNKAQAQKLKARISILSNQSYNAGSGAAAHLSEEWLSKKVAEVHRMVDDLTDQAPVSDGMDSDTVEWAIEEIGEGGVDHRIKLSETTFRDMGEWMMQFPLRQSERIVRRTRLTPTEDWEGWEPV